jgi:hypothetical protein
LARVTSCLHRPCQITPRGAQLHIPTPPALLAPAPLPAPRVLFCAASRHAGGSAPAPCYSIRAAASAACSARAPARAMPGPRAVRTEPQPAHLCSRACLRQRCVVPELPPGAALPSSRSRTWACPCRALVLAEPRRSSSA